LGAGVVKKLGSGFLLNTGIIVTNRHVVQQCPEDRLRGRSSLRPQLFRFSKRALDPKRDLALLRPAEPLVGGLDLGSDRSPDLGPTVVKGLRESGYRTHGGFEKTLPDGSKVAISNEEAVAEVIDEFYKLVQVGLGEAIAASELKAFITDNAGF